MKNLSKKLLLVLLAVLPCFETTTMAMTDGDIGEPSEIPLKGKPGDSGTRPRLRAPRRGNTVVTTPECYYYNGEVSIYAPSEITAISATVERVDDNAQWYGSCTDSELTFTVSSEPGDYILTLTLSDGTSYYGEYSLY